MIYGTRAYGKSYRVFSYFIFTIIKNYVCIDYPDCQLKKLSELPVGYGGGYKHEKNILTEYWVIKIPYFLMNLMSCHC